MSAPTLEKTCTLCARELPIGMFYDRGSTRKNQKEARCKDCHREYSARVYREHKAQHAARARLWRQRNPEKVKEYRINHAARNPGYGQRGHIVYKSKPKNLFGIYRRSAEKRGISFQLSFDEFMLYWEKSCFYCGDTIKTAGLDRLDNNQGYHRENIVACCRPCNYAKHDGSQRDFIARCCKIAARHGVRL